jgi:hypothetical protein
VALRLHALDRRQVHARRDVQVDLALEVRLGEAALGEAALGAAALVVVALEEVAFFAAMVIS